MAIADDYRDNYLSMMVEIEEEPSRKGLKVMEREAGIPEEVFERYVPLVLLLDHVAFDLLEALERVFRLVMAPPKKIGHLFGAIAAKSRWIFTGLTWKAGMMRRR